MECAGHDQPFYLLCDIYIAHDHVGNWHICTWKPTASYCAILVWTQRYHLDCASVLEANKGTGITHIALVRIVEDVAVIFVQFAVWILACSLAMTKVLLAGRSFTGDDEGVLRSEGLEIFTFLILSVFP